MIIEEPMKVEPNPEGVIGIKREANHTIRTNIFNYIPLQISLRIPGILL
jgi:hypothetical protein